MPLKIFQSVLVASLKSNNLIGFSENGQTFLLGHCQCIRLMCTCIMCEVFVLCSHGTVKRGGRESFVSSLSCPLEQCH